MKESMTSDRIGNAILLKRKKVKNFIIVEGSHDLLFFLKFKSEGTQIEMAFGWERVIEVIDFLISQNYLNVLGIIDRDLRQIVPENLNLKPNIVLTDFHDINIETIEFSFDVILKSYQSEEKKERFCSENNIGDIKEYVYEMSKPLSMFRVLSKREKYYLPFKGKSDSSNKIDYSKFIDKDKFVFISISKLVESVMNFARPKAGKPLPSNQQIEEKLCALIEEEGERYTNTELTNGHDFGEIICLGLKKSIGSKQHITSDQFLRDCILNYESLVFYKTAMYNSIRKVEVDTLQEYLRS